MKIIKLPVLLFLLLPLGSCGGEPVRNSSWPDSEVAIKMYVSNEAYASFFQKAAESYFQEHPYNHKISFQARVLGEGGTIADGNLLLTSSQTIKNLRQIYGFLPWDPLESNKDSVEEKFYDEGKLYGLPFGAENGNYIFYDDRHFSEGDFQNLDSFVQKSKTLQGGAQDVLLQSTEYLSAFAGFGVTLSFQTKKQEQTLTVSSVHSTFDSSSALTGAKALSHYISLLPKENPSHGNETFLSGGLYLYEQAKAKFGEHLRIAPIPDFVLGDKTYSVSPTYVDQGIAMYNVSDSWKGEIIKELVQELVSPSGQTNAFQTLGFPYVPANQLARERCGIDSKVFFHNYGKGFQFASFPYAMLEHFNPLLEAIISDGGQGDEAKLSQALKTYHEAMMALEGTVIA